MTSKSDWVAFHSADFLVGTAELTDAEVGAYIRLLAHQHQRGALPADLGQLAKIVPGARKAWPALKGKFVPCGEGLIRNERMARECEAADRRLMGYQERSKAANESRWRKPRSVPQPSLTDSNRDPSGSPSGTPTGIRDGLLEVSHGEKSREEKTPQTPRGLRGPGDGVAAPAEPDQPSLSLVRSLHRSAETALRTMIRVRGEELGRGDFDGAVATRLRQAVKRFAELGVAEDEAHQLAERTLTLWSWDEWSDTLGSLVSAAKSKESPPGWITWRINGGQNDRAQAATA